MCTLVLAKKIWNCFWIFKYRATILRVFCSSSDPSKTWNHLRIFILLTISRVFCRSSFEKYEIVMELLYSSDFMSFLSVVVYLRFLSTSKNISWNRRFRRSAHLSNYRSTYDNKQCLKILTNSYLFWDFVWQNLQEISRSTLPKERISAFCNSSLCTALLGKILRHKSWNTHIPLFFHNFPRCFFDFDNYFFDITFTLNFDK